MGGNLKIMKVTSFSETSTSSRKRRSTDKATANFEAEITTDDSTSDDEVKDSITETIKDAVDTYDSLDTDSFNSIDIENLTDCIWAVILFCLLALYSQS